MPKPSSKKRQMYAPVAAHLSPKFRIDGGVSGQGKSSAESYRRTQPNFHMDIG